jgi:transposase InsO family protein
MERLRDVEPKHYAEALRREALIMPFLNGEKRLTGRKRERSIRRYIAKYREAKAFYTIGVVGLLPNWAQCGTGTRRLPDEVHALMDEVITTEYETPVQKNVSLAHAKLLERLCEKKIPEKFHPSYETFRQKILSRDKKEQTRKRKGKRAAYAHEKLVYWIDKDTPPQGDRPFHIAHADHTKLDIRCVCSYTGQDLGRPWASFLVDAYTRRLLAIVVTFDPPSYRSTMLLFRECVRHYKRLPQIVVVDNGSEFDNVYFRRFAADFNMIIKFRPKGKPRHGSVGERLFGIATRQFVNALMGNTQIMKEVRKVVPSVNPTNLAVWTLEEFTKWFTAWGYTVYDRLPHWTLLQSPLEAYARAITLTGARDKSFIPFDENFLIMTMPATRKLTAKNNYSRGIKVNNIYYHHPELDRPNLEGRQLYVKYDPYNISIAYVYTGSHWVRCMSTYYGTFDRLTERQLAIISQELRRRKQQHLKNRSLSMREIARFIETVERVQSGLAARRFLNQRQKDLEARPMLRLINGGLADVPDSKHVAAKPPTVASEDKQEVASSFNDIDFSKLKRLGGL